MGEERKQGLSLAQGTPRRNFTRATDAATGLAQATITG
jgi:hypothetical protein